MKKRIDRVYELVKSHTDFLDADTLTAASGLTTQDVATALNIQRSNASKDLNALVKEGVLDKFDGRPVRYVCKSVFRHKPLTKHVESYLEKPREAKKRAIAQVDYPTEASDIFQRIVGANGSMRNPVEQAKASILYPPKGLNCLIVGPTGSGKTYFAHTMFQFAKQCQVVAENKEMVVFNCADYASNPELLMSHLFGHAKGAFTGASEEKDGLLTLANNSFLFLDEVHRLPPEGQEMIFYFMDTGQYARLGETTKQHQANVRIICATTEDPSSALLNTFVRRIPITIQLPNFVNRPEKEKVDLVRVMMSMEAKRIQRKIVLTDDVIKALVGSVGYGNVGQLKSNVQLVTARAFLNHMDQDELLVTVNELNESIKEGLAKLAHNRQNMAELAYYVPQKMIISPNESYETFETDAYELPYNLYDIIGDKAAVLKDEGFNQEAINHFISTDINVHLKSFYRNHGFSFDADSQLLEIMDETVIRTTKQIFEFSKQSLNYEFQTNFLYAMGLHISSFINRMQSGKYQITQDNESIEKMVLHYPDEREVAEEIKLIIEREHSVSVPRNEVNYLTVLLVSLKENKSDGRIGIVVAAHGVSTASSMVQVVKQLLNVTNLRSVDMPLDMQPKEAKEKIIKEVIAVNEGSGVLLLVDMGSLGTFSEDIENQTHIMVKTVDMVTTATVLEAARKASLIETDINQLHQSLINFHGYAKPKVSVIAETKLRDKKAIIAICASGQGTAQRMKDLLDDYLQASVATDITVFPISVLDINQQLSAIRQEYEVIAITGITQPNIDIPFIPMDVLFSPEGKNAIKHVVSQQCTETYPELNLSEAKAVCLEFMLKSFTFINPEKLIDPLWHVADLVTSGLKLVEKPAFYTNLCLHLAGSIERELRKDTLTATKEDISVMKRDNIYDTVVLALSYLRDTLKVEFCDSEVFYTYQIVKNF
ncbi:transcription antiterminator BglG [Vagococcus penaei]|uniref:Transcription antiterminator BglG n=1 Tax=Vagococcus penaei TaxID=633807 RepID=A0A1Q2D7A4_9ENTE|nr:sigma-54-dependent transcriptional regulator [Vagococcus penaei]AQP54227.1 transcription antiterminator BglG [Vagococcus penaei]RST98248.1 transcription antiterminator BglG [Vagococcus penaei]